MWVLLLVNWWAEKMNFKLDGSEITWLVYADWLEDQGINSQHIRESICEIKTEQFHEIVFSHMPMIPDMNVEAYGTHAGSGYSGRTQHDYVGVSKRRGFVAGGSFWVANVGTVIFTEVGSDI